MSVNFRRVAHRFVQTFCKPSGKRSKRFYSKETFKRTVISPALIVGLGFSAGCAIGYYIGLNQNLFNSFVNKMI